MSLDTANYSLNILKVLVVDFSLLRFSIGKLKKIKNKKNPPFIAKL